MVEQSLEQRCEEHHKSHGVITDLTELNLGNNNMGNEGAICLSGGVGKVAESEAFGPRLEQHRT